MKISFSNRTNYILGRKGKNYTAIFLVSSLLIAFIEYTVAFFLILFLYSVGFISRSDIPAFIPERLIVQSPFILWFLLMGITLFRGTTLFISSQIGYMIIGYVQRRFMIFQGFEMLFTDRHHALSLSTVNTRNSELIPKSTNYIYNVLMVIAEFNNAVLIFIGMVYLAPAAALVSVVCLGLIGFIFTKVGKKIITISNEIPRQQKDMEKSIVRIIKNWFLIRILHIEHIEYENYKTSVIAYNKLSDRTFFFQNMAAVLPPFWGIFIIAIVIFLDFQFFHTQSVRLVTFLYFFIRFMHITSNGAKFAGYIAMYRAPYKTLTNMIDSLSKEERDEVYKKIEEEDNRPQKKQPPAAEDTSLHGPPSLRIHECSYTWPGTSLPVITDLSLSIQPGEHLGITGPNGSGKSTLLSLILGIIKPTKGEIIINDMSVTNYIQNHFDTIAYVSSDHYLLQGTIMDNLSYGSIRQIQENEAWNVLTQVGLDTIIREFPEGLHHILREEGEGLSSGQKQRLAIARAMLRQPQLLVLDEASSNIDTASEKSLIHFLQGIKGLCTVIIVSHKRDILTDADKIIKIGEHTHDKTTYPKNAASPRL